MFDSNRRAIAPRKHPGRSWLSPDEGWPGVGQEGWATRIWATAGCEECTLGSVKAEQPGGIWCTPLLERYPIGPGKEHGRREAHTHAACPGCVCARACVLAQVCVSVCSMPRPRVVGPAGPPEHNYVSTGRVRVRAECSLCCPGSATVPAAPDEGGKVCRVRHACSLSPLSLAHAEALVGYPQSVIPFRPPPPPPLHKKIPHNAGLFGALHWWPYTPKPMLMHHCQLGAIFPTRRALLCVYSPVALPARRGYGCACSTLLRSDSSLFPPVPAPLDYNPPNPVVDRTTEYAFPRHQSSPVAWVLIFAPSP